MALANRPRKAYLVSESSSKESSPEAAFLGRRNGCTIDGSKLIEGGPKRKFELGMATVVQSGGQLCAAV